MEGALYLLVLVVCAAVSTKEASAAQHAVGGSQGWDESTDFTSWASAQTFKVGDQLEFKYSGLHSVVELANESAYKSCSIGNSVDSMSGGNSVVKLDKAGTRYFACGTMGHCDQGMKVKITTVSSDGSSSSPSSPSSSSSSSSSPSSSSSSNNPSVSSSPHFASSTSFMAIVMLTFFSVLIMS